MVAIKAGFNVCAVHLKQQSQRGIRISNIQVAADWIGGGIGDDAYRSYQSCYDRLNSN